MSFSVLVSTPPDCVRQCSDVESSRSRKLLVVFSEPVLKSSLWERCVECTQESAQRQLCRQAQHDGCQGRKTTNAAVTYYRYTYRTCSTTPCLLVPLGFAKMSSDLLFSDYETSTSAEEKKELGNKAFAAKEYKEAISYYTEAIQLDPKNHIYYSNRSACYVSLEQWAEAAFDAKECLKLSPNFLKAYYRLSLAQMEMGELDAAHSTIKLGLNLDPNNAQLMKQVRVVNAKKKDAAKKGSSSESPSSSSAIPSDAAAGFRGTVDSEIIDLQNQFRATLRDYNICKSTVEKYQREHKIHELTKVELDKLPMSSDSKMYHGIGKMFLLSSREDVMAHLDEDISAANKKETEMTAKLEYLEKRMKSQQQNIAELTKSLPTIAT